MPNKRATQAGIGHVHPHQRRHTWADRWLRAGGNEGDLQRLGGWESAEIMRRYGAARAVDRALAAYDTVNPMGRLCARPVVAPEVVTVPHETDGGLRLGRASPSLPRPCGLQGETAEIGLLRRLSPLLAFDSWKPAFRIDIPFEPRHERLPARPGGHAGIALRVHGVRRSASTRLRWAGVSAARWISALPVESSISAALRGVVAGVVMLRGYERHGLVSGEEVSDGPQPVFPSTTVTCRRAAASPGPIRPRPGAGRSGRRPRGAPVTTRRTARVRKRRSVTVARLGGSRRNKFE